MTSKNAHPSTAIQPAALRAFAGVRCRPRALWELRGEASLNWLALGLLLAAWNGVDDSAAIEPRPEALRAYPCVSVRGAHRANAVDFTTR